MLTEKTVFDALPAAEIKVGDLAAKMGLKERKSLIAVLMRLKRKGAIKLRKPFLSQKRVQKIVTEYPKPKCRIIAVINLKGGVGKTITTVNIAACLAQLGHKTLIMDLDPQANATQMMKAPSEKTVYGMLTRGQDAMEAVQKTRYQNLDIIPSEMNLVAAEAELMRPGGVSGLKEALGGIRDEYEYVLIDCQPSLSLLSLNALEAADSIIVPVQCDQFALLSLERLMQTMKSISHLNPDLHIEGIIISAFENEKMLCNETLNAVQEKYRDLIYDTIIHRDDLLSEAAAKGIPVIHYGEDSEIAQSYMKIANEVSSSG